jgi:hypothetical protein
MSTAEAKFRRADRMYHIALKAFFVFAAIMLTIIAYQVAHLQGDFSSAQTAELKRQEQSRTDAQKRLSKALEETQHQQLVTQNYIRCMALVSLKPVEQRSAADYDACGIPGITDPDKLGRTDSSQTSSATKTGIITPNTKSTASKHKQPAMVCSPIDNNNSANDRSIFGRLPFIGGLFRAIGF